jgi:hypothetical protein
MAEAAGTPLARLAAWYAAQCDGTWEHRYGVSIQSTDNPGWWVKVDVVGTSLAGRTFETAEDGIDDGGHPVDVRWLRCYLEKDVWNGAGDQTRLPEIVERFCVWAGAES